MILRKCLVAVLAAMSFGMSLQAQEKFGVVELSVCYMRQAPDYEAALETQALMGTPAEILDRDGYWLKIRTPEPYVAWVTDMAVMPMDSVSLRKYIAEPKYICLAQHTEMWSEPSVRSLRVGDMVQGDIVRIWYNAKGRPVKSGNFLGVMLPSGRKAYVTASVLADFTEWARTRRATPENLVSLAKAFNGTPYLWGGESAKGFDCSGLTRTVFFLNGVLLPRNASQQVKVGHDVDISGLQAALAVQGRPVTSFGDLHPGDLLFFGNKATQDKKERITHVGLYIGDGRMIHSSHMVRINSLNPAEPDYYTGSTRLLHARRMCAPDGTPYTEPEITDSEYYFPK